MKRMWVWLGVLLVSIALATTAPAGAQDKKLTIVVGGLEKIIYLPAMLTQRLDYFKQAGVEVELVNQAAGVDAEVELLAGRVDGVVGFYDHSIDLQSKGKFVEAVINFDHVPGEALMVAGSSGITKLADLRGKRIGVTGLGSSTNFLATFLVTKGGGGPGDYTPLAVGAGNTLIAAMQQGRIDAAVTTEPTISRLVKSGLARVLVDMRTAPGTKASLGGTYPAASLYMRNDWVNSNKEIVQKVVNAFVKTLQYLKTHKAPQVAEMMPEDYYAGDKPLYLTALGASMNMFNPTGLMPPDGPATVLNVLATFNKDLDPKKVDLSKTFTDEFVKNATKGK